MRTSPVILLRFPISRDPPEGGTAGVRLISQGAVFKFPISRDPPEGGTRVEGALPRFLKLQFPISRDPPEGGTFSNKLGTVNPG